MKYINRIKTLQIPTACSAAVVVFHIQVLKFTTRSCTFKSFAEQFILLIFTTHTQNEIYKSY